MSCNTVKDCVVLYVCLLMVKINSEQNFSVLNEDNELENIVSCIKDVIYTYYEGRPLYLLQEEVRDSVAEHLIKSGLNATWMITTAQGNDYKIHQHGMFILQPSEDNPKVNYSLLLAGAYKSSYFLIVWPVGTKISSLEKLHQEFWSNQLLRVISLIPLDDGDTNVYTYFPYGRRHCNSANRPVIVDKCRNKTLSKNFKMFSATSRLQNFYGCKVRLFGNNQLPEVTTWRDKEGSWYIKGNVLMLLTAMSKHYNFTPQLVGVFEDTHGWFFYNDTVQTKLVQMENFSVEFGFGSYSYLTFLSEQNVDYSFLGTPECFTWAVPPLAGKRPSIWINYVDEFPATVWSLIATFFVGTTVVVIVMAKYSVNEKRQFTTVNRVVFSLFASLVLQSSSLQPRSKPLKMLLLQWTCWMTVLHMSYEALLGSFMTVQWPVENIKTAKEIVDNGMRVTGGVQMQKLLKTASMGNRELRTLYDRFEVLPPTSLDNIVNSIYEDRDLVVLFPKRFVLHSSRYRARLINKTDRVYLIDECVWKTYASPFVTRKGAFMMEPINEFTHRIYEAGLFKHWRTKDGHFKERPKIDAKTFSREHLQGAYVILFIGCLISFICFLIEIFYFKYIYQKYSKRNVLPNTTTFSFYN